MFDHRKERQEMREQRRERKANRFEDSDCFEDGPEMTEGSYHHRNRKERFGRDDKKVHRRHKGPGRLFGHGGIRLLVLSMIGEEPRHGYEIIKAIEEATFSFYVPSPGVIYPTLTYLEEAGYIVATADGNKKSYSVTDEGRAFLEEHSSEIAKITSRVEEFSERASRIRNRQDKEEDVLPRSVEAAFLNLRESIAAQLESEPTSSTGIVQKLLSLAEEIKR